MHTRLMLPLAALIALTLAGPLAAQPPAASAPGGAPNIEQRLARMSEQLDLNDAQREAISAIFQTQAEERARLMVKMREQIDAVLTQEQRAARDARIAERIDRRVARMDSRLDLSDEQAAKLKTLLTEMTPAERLQNPGAMREQLASMLTEEQFKAWDRSAGGRGPHPRAYKGGYPGGDQQGCRR